MHLRICLVNLITPRLLPFYPFILFDSMHILSLSSVLKNRFVYTTLLILKTRNFSTLRKIVRPSKWYIRNIKNKFLELQYKNFTFKQKHRLCNSIKSHLPTNKQNPIATTITTFVTIQICVSSADHPCSVLLHTWFLEELQPSTIPHSLNAKTTQMYSTPIPKWHLIILIIL